MAGAHRDFYIVWAPPTPSNQAAYNILRIETMANFDTAIQRFQSGLDAAPDHFPDRSERLYSLGAGYQDRYQRTGALVDLEITI